MSRWVRTVDRLPEHGVTVLAWLPGCGFRLTYRTWPDSNGVWGWSGACGNVTKRRQPTYWMPLPASPIEEETNAMETGW